MTSEKFNLKNLGPEIEAQKSQSFKKVEQKNLSHVPDSPYIGSYPLLPSGDKLPSTAHLEDPPSVQTSYKGDDAICIIRFFWIIMPKSKRWFTNQFIWKD